MHSPFTDVSAQLIVLPDFVIPLTNLPTSTSDPGTDITVSGVCDYLLALVPPDIGRTCECDTALTKTDNLAAGLRDRPQLLQNEVPDVTCFAVF